jgi:hypothetical protein
MQLQVSPAFRSTCRERRPDRGSEHHLLQAASHRYFLATNEPPTRRSHPGGTISLRNSPWEASTPRRLQQDPRG